MPDQVTTERRGALVFVDLTTYVLGIAVYIRALAIRLVTPMPLLAASSHVAVVPTSAVTRSEVLRSSSQHCNVRWRPTLWSTGWSATSHMFFLLNPSVRWPSHLSAPGSEDVGNTSIGSLRCHKSPAVSFQMQAVVVAFGVLIMLLVMLEGPLRADLLMGYFVISVVLIGASLCHLVRSIWIDQTLTFAVPLLMFTTVRNLVAVKARWARAGRQLVVSWMQTQLPRKFRYEEAAQFVRQHNPNAAATYTPVNVAFWGTSKYHRDAESRSLLSVQNPSQRHRSEFWLKVYDESLPGWLSRLGLMLAHGVPQTARDGLWIGPSPLLSSVSRLGMWMFGASENEAAEVRGYGVSVWRCGQPLVLGR